MIYIETMVGHSQMIPCAECGTSIRWPDEARMYALTANDKPSRIEHASHPVLDGSVELES